jgi:hypothetical protein
VVKGTMSSMIYTPTEIDVSKIEFQAPKVMDNGGKTVGLHYEGRNITLETGSLFVPYGVNVFDKTPGAPVKYSVDVSLRGVDEHEYVRDLQSFLEAFDERMIDAGVENSQKWFKMTPNRDVIKAFYTPSLKYSRDATGALKPYPPTLKIALRKNDKGPKKGEFTAPFYNGSAKDEEGSPTLFDVSTPVEEVLAKRSMVTIIAQCTGVWFAGGKFGVTWKAHSIRVDSQPSQLRGPAFRTEAPDIRAFVTKALASSGGGHAGGHTGGFTGGDAEAEDEEETAPVESVLKAVLPSAPAPRAAPATFVEENVSEPVAPPKRVFKKAAGGAGAAPAKAGGR